MGLGPKVLLWGWPFCKPCARALLLDAIADAIADLRCIILDVSIATLFFLVWGIIKETGLDGQMSPYTTRGGCSLLVCSVGRRRHKVKCVAQLPRIPLRKDT